MKPGDLVTPKFGRQELYEGIRDGERSFVNGHSFFPNEFGMILETYHWQGNNVYHRILTTRGSTGWISELHVSIR